MTLDEAALKAARQDLSDGAVTPADGPWREQIVALLNGALATELTCVLRYRRHHVTACAVHGRPWRRSRVLRTGMVVALDAPDMELAPASRILASRVVAVCLENTARHAGVAAAQVRVCEQGGSRLAPC